MELSDVIERVGALAVNTLDQALPVPLGAGRWRALWLQYVPRGEKGERCEVFDACLFDADGGCVHAEVGEEVLLADPGEGGDAPEVDETLPGYLAWLAEAVADGSAGLDDALARTGTRRLRPLYEVALAACERAAEGE